MPVQPVGRGDGTDFFPTEQRQALVAGIGRAVWTGVPEGRRHEGVRSMPQDVVLFGSLEFHQPQVRSLEGTASIVTFSHGDDADGFLFQVRDGGPVIEADGGIRLYETVGAERGVLPGGPSLEYHFAAFRVSETQAGAVPPVDQGFINEQFAPGTDGERGIRHDRVLLGCNRRAS